MREKEVGASEETSGLSEDAIYKIDIPANRYDLLCIEGIASALRIFLQKDNRAEFKVVTPPPEKIITMKVRAEVRTRIRTRTRTRQRPLLPRPVKKTSFLSSLYNNIRFPDLKKRKGPLRVMCSERRGRRSRGLRHIQCNPANAYQCHKSDSTESDPVSPTDESRTALCGVRSAQRRHL